MIEVSRLKDLNAAKLFLGFCIGAISRRHFAVFPVQGQRGLRRLKSYFGDQMSVGAQMVVVRKAFVERRLPLVLGHRFEFSWLDVSQTYVFHGSSPPGGSQHCLARWIVHPIVVAYRENRQHRRIIFYFNSSSRLARKRRSPPVAPGRGVFDTKHGPLESALVAAQPHGKTWGTSASSFPPVFRRISLRAGYGACFEAAVVRLFTCFRRVLASEPGGKESRA